MIIMEDKALIITLEDNENYLVIDKIGYKEDVYIYLVNENDSTDFCIRKRSLKDNEEYLVGLSSDYEFDFALGLFADVHKNDDLKEDLTK